MRKVLFGIFAHPDDEAFGPAGTLLKLKDEGVEIHLLLLTDGDAGVNGDGVLNLAKTRVGEWQASATILGASSTTAFHYPDGLLETFPSSELDKKVSETIKEKLTDSPEPIEVSYMTFEPRGLTDHRDHIVASEVTTRIAGQSPIWYFCLDSTQAPLEGTAYYEPHAREDSYITDKIDVSSYLPKIYQMIDAHVSQREDGAKRKALGNERLAIECFHREH